ncbi:hypothetical protein [Candidatus Uabimicrobium sp. HlEnr_7]|uniref:hypothetical protein n=1 Tax=Candidatus Uabimicrobium helgolandensis TaxID=3095367 RepID=UPI00355884FA
MKNLTIVLICIFISLGCDPKKTEQNTTNNDKSHHHSHTPQYGGVLIEIGDHFAHAEMVVKEGNLSLHILDAEAENNVRLEQDKIQVKVKANEVSFELSLEGVASELTGETEKNTSHFRASHEKLKGMDDFTATVTSLMIKGQKFENISFTFAPSSEDHDHDDHGHDHDH